MVLKTDQLTKARFYLKINIYLKGINKFIETLIQFMIFLMKYKKELKCIFLFIKTLKRKDFLLIFFALCLWEGIQPAHHRTPKEWV